MPANRTRDKAGREGGDWFPRVVCTFRTMAVVVLQFPATTPTEVSRPKKQKASTPGASPMSEVFSLSPGEF
jgi:hypothetical protein